MRSLLWEVFLGGSMQFFQDAHMMPCRRHALNHAIASESRPLRLHRRAALVRRTPS
jgi:hypothetical protein